MKAVWAMAWYSEGLAANWNGEEQRGNSIGGHVGQKAMTSGE